MRKPLAPYLQYVLPQHLLSRLAGRLSTCRTPWLKNMFIRRFMKAYSIDLQEALHETADAYANFEDFFTRQLKPHVRTIASAADAIASPVDGCVAQIGRIRKHQLLQAKDFYFDLAHLLGGDHALASLFHDGAFSTLYLAPHNYHRVHLPIAGKLLKTIYVPGKLFSVNKHTSQIIPQLYSRNERLICIFSTDAGMMAVILVGALIVGSMQTVWMDKPIRAKHMLTHDFSEPLEFAKGAELGHFKLGSTVILLFEKNHIQWEPSLAANSLICFGEQIGKALFHS